MTAPDESALDAVRRWVFPVVGSLLMGSLTLIASQANTKLDRALDLIQQEREERRTATARHEALDARVRELEGWRTERDRATTEFWQTYGPRLRTP